MNRRPSFADRIRQIREARQLEEAVKVTQPIQEAEASKAAELARLDKIVDNSSDKNRNFFIAYLGLLIYVQAIIFSTSDLKLLLPNQELKLPLIDLGVPLVGFYFSIPIFVIALHFNFLQNLESHHYKLMRWQQAQPNAKVPRSRINPFLFDFAILEQNSGFRNWVLWANTILCYNLAPITLALLLFRYADRQDFPMTVWHYAAFVVDSYLVWRLRKALLENEKLDDAICVTGVDKSLPIEKKLETSNRSRIVRFKLWVRRLIMGLWKEPCRFIVNFLEFVKGSFQYRPHGIIGLIVLLELILSFLIAETDDDTFNRYVLSWAKSWVDIDSRPVEWILPRIMIKPTETIWQVDDKAMKIEAELAGESNWVKYFNEQGHGFRPDPNSLRLVDLFKQKIPRAQLSLGGWSLSLQGADLSMAQMQGADLSMAQMQGADLSYAQMQGANLEGAQMQGADLTGAQMQRANPGGAKIGGGPQMQGANLTDAQMQGANLTVAKMQGAYLGGAQMQGADLTGAQMQGANLTGAQMQGADLSLAQMQGANLSANMQGADLSQAQVQGADLSYAQMQGVILSSTFVQGALLTTEIPVYGSSNTELFDESVTDWAKIEKLADEIPDPSKRQEYLDRIKKAQQPEQINQARVKFHYDPKTIANSALTAVCDAKDYSGEEASDEESSNEEYSGKLLPKETRLAWAQAFRKSYINISDYLKQNQDYPNILLDIDYQLCTLKVCKDLRDGIEGLDCQKASQNPPKW